jgi:5-methylcytosine-specific restriction enzyme A
MPSRPAVHHPPWWKPKAAREKQRLAKLDQQRPPSSRRGYDKAWRALRKQFLDANPICSERGCWAEASDVDHIETIAARPDLRLDWNNLRALCHRHHSRHTALTQGFARPRS